MMSEAMDSNLKNKTKIKNKKINELGPPYPKARAKQ